MDMRTSVDKGNIILSGCTPHGFLMGVNYPVLMEKRRRDLPVTIYRVLLYLSRMRERESDARRLMRIERAVSVDRKELRLHLQRLHEAGHVEITERSGKGRGGHPVLIYDITENGKTLRSDIGRWIDLGVRMGYYPDSFFYLPSDE